MPAALPLRPSLPASPASYWHASRAPRYSLLFALPLFVLYETLAWMLSGDRVGSVRNGADVIIRQSFMALAGSRGSLVFVAVITGVAIWLVARDVRRHGSKLRLPVFVGMFAESMVMALLVGIIAGTITANLLNFSGVLAIGPIEEMSLPMRIMLSLGAGLYEELLFRVVLVGALAWLGRRVLGWKPWPSGVMAAVGGALIFSAFHYVGAYGDPFELQSFVFRAVAGLYFSVLFLLRGFGIAAWSHALYDIAVLT